MRPVTQSLVSLAVCRFLFATFGGVMEFPCLSITCLIFLFQSSD